MHDDLLTRAVRRAILAKGVQDMESSQHHHSNGQQPEAIALGDAQVTHGKLADSVDADASVAFVPPYAEFAIAPQAADGVPFDIEVEPATDLAPVPVNEHITDDERARYRKEVEMYQRAQQMGEQALGRRRFRGRWR